MAELPFLWDMAGLKQTARIKDADIALEFTHCHHPEGNIAAKKAWFYLYELDIRGAKTLTLPEDNRLIIMAMTAVKKYANTTLATPLLDTITGDYDFDDIPFSSFGTAPTVGLFWTFCALSFLLLAPPQ